MPSLIGVAGGTGTGKSTVVRALAERFGGVVVDLDSYYLDRSGIAVEERGRINYDEPAAIDVRLLLDPLRRLAAGEMVAKPTYSFRDHARVGAQVVLPARLILVDGLFTLWWDHLRALLDLKVFVDVPADLRLARRIRRDVAERGRTADSVLAQYLSTVRPIHHPYIQPTRVHADLVIANVGPIGAAVERVVAAVRMIANRPGVAVTGTP